MNVSETGDCIGCREGSEGRSCGRCSAGFDGDPTRGIPCAETAVGGGSGRNCDCYLDGSLDIGKWGVAYNIFRIDHLVATSFAIVYFLPTVRVSCQFAGSAPNYNPLINPRRNWI